MCQRNAGRLVVGIEQGHCLGHLGSYFQGARDRASSLCQSQGLKGLECCAKESDPYLKSKEIISTSTSIFLVHCWSHSRCLVSICRIEKGHPKGI